MRSIKKAFESVAATNYWGDPDSVSGPGSNLQQTRVIRTEIPVLLHRYGILSLLDAPCGDLFWMQNILPYLSQRGIHYFGADIVPAIIDQNIKKFKSSKIDFITVDLTRGPIPTVDLIFTRDCFIHLSFKNIVSILSQYKKSGSKYLLVSTYSNEVRRNFDVKGFYIRGRALNMQRFPFYLDKPLDVIVEGCTERNGEYSDKSLGLWEFTDINITRMRLLLPVSYCYSYLNRIYNKMKYLAGSLFRK